MGITIVLVVMLITGVILVKKGGMFSFGEEIGIASGITGAIGVIVCVIVILLQQTVCNYDKRIELEEKYNAIQRIMNDNDFKNGDVRVKNQVYNDIAEYNADIRTNKHYRDSVWTNWFVCRCYDDFEVIEYDGE